MSKSDGVSLHKIPKPTHGEIMNGARPFVSRTIPLPIANFLG